MSHLDDFVGITVLMPTFNSASTIATALDSLFEQTFPFFEVIIIDNLSTDKTLEIIEHHALKNITVISEKDSGIYEALNKGIRRAKGQYITILHSTDLYNSKSCLQSSYAFLKAHNLAFCFGNAKIFDRDTGRIVRTLNYQKFTKSWIRFGYMPPHPTLVISLSLINEHELLYDERYEICGDFEMVIRLFNISSAIYDCNTEFCILMDNKGKSSQKIKNFLTMNKEMFLAFAQNSLTKWFFIALFRYLIKAPELFKGSGKRTEL